MTPSDLSQTKTGTLYVVGTPIGNMEDITLRALRILKEADIIASEDTRQTGKLLAHYGIRSRRISYHEHNEAQRTPYIITKLKNGVSVALVSNAGTPLVSDPGYRLVRGAVASGIRVSPVPGVSAAIAGLSASGLPSDAFVFEGFPSRKKSKQEEKLRNLSLDPRTLIFYENPKRMLPFLEKVGEVLGDRQAVLCREMTKVYEEFIRGKISELIATLKKREAIRGEFTIIVEGQKNETADAMTTVREDIRQGLASGKHLSQLVKDMSKIYGLPRKQLYETALEIKQELKP